MPGVLGSVCPQALNLLRRAGQGSWAAWHISGQVKDSGPLDSFSARGQWPMSGPLPGALGQWPLLPALGLAVGPCAAALQMGNICEPYPPPPPTSDQPFPCLPSPRACLNASSLPAARGCQLGTGPAGSLALPPEEGWLWLHPWLGVSSSYVNDRPCGEFLVLPPQKAAKAFCGYCAREVDSKLASRCFQ